MYLHDSSWRDLRCDDGNIGCTRSRARLRPLPWQWWWSSDGRVKLIRCLLFITGVAMLPPRSDGFVDGFWISIQMVLSMELGFRVGWFLSWLLEMILFDFRLTDILWQVWKLCLDGTQDGVRDLSCSKWGCLVYIIFLWSIKSSMAIPRHRWIFVWMSGQLGCLDGSRMSKWSSSATCLVQCKMSRFR